MLELKKMDIKGLQILVEYLLRNQNSVETIILDFGEVSNDNGYGTVFLKPKNTLFKVFWVHHQNIHLANWQRLHGLIIHYIYRSHFAI